MVIVSGFHNDSERRERLEAAGFVLLDKPYTIAELGLAVERATGDPVSRPATGS